MAYTLQGALRPFGRGRGIEFDRDVVQSTLMAGRPELQLEPHDAQERQELDGAQLGKCAALELRNQYGADTGSFRGFTLGEPTCKAGAFKLLR